MSQNIQAVYENGILRPLQPLDLPENKTVNISVLDEAPDGEETMLEKADRVLRQAGLISPLNFPVTEKDILSEEERRRLGKLFSGERPLGDYIDEDREARG